MHLKMSDSMNPVKAEEFVMFGAWLRLGLDANHTVNKITDTFDFMGFGVEARKLYF